MDSQVYFEIVHYLKSGLYPRNSTWIYRRELRNRCKNYYLSRGVLLRVGSGLTVLHRGNARNKLTEMHRKTIIPPEKIWNLWRGKHLVSATYECGAEKS